ncbi:hypothetical protein [Oryzibacter oryziterrae]|uniref:hypothetical protein n=1 Tax=Oryzibacter oryziterrae TaxID=2766474 RepID=UPI001F2895D6|nr:hypothetical protein [Oryzibacter oryziterrae]
MLRLAVMIWILVGTVLAGTLVTVVLLMPSLAGEMMRFIPIAGIAGYVIGIPFAWVIAGKIIAATRNRPA